MTNNTEVNEYYYRNSDNELYFIHYYNARFVYVSKMVLKNETKTIKINESLNNEFCKKECNLCEYNSDCYDFKIKTYSPIKTEKIKMTLNSFNYVRSNTFKYDTKNNSDIRIKLKNNYGIWTEKYASPTESKIEHIIYETLKIYTKDIIKNISECLLNQYLQNDKCLLDERENHKEYNAKQKEYFESENQKKNRAYQIKMLDTFKNAEAYLDNTCRTSKVIEEYLKTIDIKI
jgi:hypothetical protein